MPGALEFTLNAGKRRSVIQLKVSCFNRSTGSPRTGPMRELTLKLFILVALLATGGFLAEARTKKGDKLLAQGKAAEIRQQFDTALDFYEQALSEDPGDSGYLLAVRQMRFQAGQAHVDAGRKLREAGKLEEALKDFEKAYAIDPSSDIAEQEIRTTQQMIDREKKPAQPGQKTEVKPEERGLTPAELAQKRLREKIANILPVPELKPISTQPINLIMNNQPPRVLWETVGKLAGINVIFDPDYMQQGAVRNQSVEFTNTTLDEALDYLAVMTKSFWKPLSSNTVFVTNDNTTKRRDYQEMVMKVFYLKNVTTTQELQEMVTNIRSMTDIKRIFAYNSQSAIIVRGEADQVALAEKIVNDLDKPRSEVVVDVIVLSALKAKTRDLTTAVAPAGLNMPIAFTPGGKTPATTTDSSGTGTTTTAASSTPTINLGNLGKITERDYSITLPGGLLEAVMTDRNTKVLQSPRIRVADGQKALLHVGDKVPIATGSFQPGLGIGGGGISPLVSTQFNFQDVGVKMEITPKIHGRDEVSLHVDAEISSVRDRIDVGGLSQPIIGQTKVTHDIRIKEGEVSVLGGLLQTQESKSVTGVPGLSSIPVIRRLFTGETVEKSESELLIVLVPHIVRAPEITPDNLKAVDVGTDAVVKLNYAPRQPAPGEPQPAIAPKPLAPPQPVTPTPGPATPAPAPSPAGPAPGGPPRTAPPIPGLPGAPPPAQPPPAAAQPEGQARIVITPSQLDAQVGATVSVNVNVENAANLLAATLRLKYDPKVLRLNDVTLGNLLSKDGQQPAPVSKNIMNDTGDATLMVRRFPAAGGVSGSGSLVTLVFQVVGKGASTITFPDLTLRNPQLQPIASGATPLAVTVR
jgi:general secretion pathway protein D